jgi:hypothetical protein
MRFFFDRCFPIRVVRMINAYETEHAIRHHDEDNRFTPTTSDIEWMTILGKDDPTWIVVSGDGRILKNKVERAALQEARLKFFCLAKAWLTMRIHEYAWKFVKVWPEIVENAKTSKASVFEVAGGKSLKITPLKQ